MEATTLTITLNLENAAFDEYPGAEISRILGQLARTLGDFNKDRDSHVLPMYVNDVNGNAVGKVTTS
jgi:hypothetical protein